MVQSSWVDMKPLLATFFTSRKTIDFSKWAGRGNTTMLLTLNNLLKLSILILVCFFYCFSEYWHYVKLVGWKINTRILTYCKCEKYSICSLTKVLIDSFIFIDTQILRIGILFWKSLYSLSTLLFYLTITLSPDSGRTALLTSPATRPCKHSITLCVLII